MTVNLSIDQSYFGRANSRPISRNNIKAQFRRNVPAIIEYCNSQAKRLKKRNEYQNILFLQDYEDGPSEDISQELKEYYQKQTQYPFYLSRCNLFIDNYHLKIIKKATPIPIKFDCLDYGRLKWFAEYVGKPQSQYLMGVTDLNYVIVVSILTQNFFKYRINNKQDGSNKKIVSLNYHERYLFVFTHDQYHILRYKRGQIQTEKLEVVLSREVGSEHIQKGYGMKVDNKYYIFGISYKNAYIWKPEEAFIRIDFMRISFFETFQGKNIDNFAVHIDGNTVTAAFSSPKQVVIKTFNTKTDSMKMIAKKQNPYSSWSLGNKKYSCYLSFIQRSTYLLCAMGFRYQLFFMRINWTDSTAEISRRVKFANQIQCVSAFGTYPGILVVLTNKVDQKVKKTIIVTHENKLASFAQYVNMHMIDKYTLQVQLLDPVQDSSNASIMIYEDRQVFMLQKSSIERAVLSLWDDIYYDMQRTQNIKLLKFLILLKLSPSPFLLKPYDFADLQSFFPLSSSLQKRIMLEYYHIMQMSPQKLNINIDRLMIPFIIEHRISNLSQVEQQNLMNHVLRIDERLVEEMIIGGAQCGWEFAVRKGWLRAFKVMVESGMQIQMPILKLYSMALYEKREIINSQLNQNIKELTPEGKKYLEQLCDYAVFLFNQYFKDLTGDVQNLQFLQILSIIFKTQVWTFLVSFAPQPSVKLITAFFLNPGIIKQLNQYETCQLNNFTQKFKHLVINRKTKNIERVLSHLSQIYKKHNSENLQPLLEQHSKIMLLNYRNFKQLHQSTQQIQFHFIRVYLIFNHAEIQEEMIFQELDIYKKMHRFLFNFKKEYLKSIFLRLIKDNDKTTNQAWQQLTSTTFFPSFMQTQPGKTCDITDFQVFVWFQIYMLIIEEAYKQREKEPQVEIKKTIRHEIRRLLADVEEYNYKSHFLSLHLMLALNMGNQYTVRIFYKYLRCENKILKARVFIFLRKFLPSCSHLQEQFIRNLKQIIEIDKEECRVLLQTFFQGRQKQIIKKLDNNPTLQLQYVELIINDVTAVVESYYSDLHIELLLKLKPESLIQNLKKNSQFVQYDLSQALRLVSESADFKEKNDILIYLYETQGEINKCVDTYLNILEAFLLQFIQLSEKEAMQGEDELTVLKTNVNLNYEGSQLSFYNPEISLILQQLQDKFQALIKLIYRQMQMKYEYHQISLSKFGQICYNIQIQNYKCKDQYVLLLSNLMGNYIVKMFEHNSLDYFSKWLQQYQGKCQLFSNIQQYLIQVYNKILIEIVTLKSTAAMDRKILVKQVKETIADIEFCISSEAQCHVCLQRFNNDQINIDALLFSCGHLYHKGCIERVHGQDFCFYCVSTNQYKSMIDNQNLNLVDLLNKFRAKKKQMSKSGNIMQIKLKQTLLSADQKKRNRLRLFDKKVNSIETEAQIIDLKMVIQDYYKSQTMK